MTTRNAQLWLVDIGRFRDRVVDVVTPRQAGLPHKDANYQILHGESGSCYLQSYSTAVEGVLNTPVGRIHCEMWGGYSLSTSRHRASASNYPAMCKYSKEADLVGVFNGTTPFNGDYYVGLSPFEESSWYDPQGNPYENILSVGRRSCAIGRKTWFDREDCCGSNLSFWLIEHRVDPTRSFFTVHNPAWDKYKKYLENYENVLTHSFEDKEEAIAYGYMNHLGKRRYLETKGRLRTAA